MMKKNRRADEDMAVGYYAQYDTVLLIVRVFKRIAVNS